MRDTYECTIRAASMKSRQSSAGFFVRAGRLARKTTVAAGDRVTNERVVH